MTLRRMVSGLLLAVAAPGLAWAQTPAPATGSSSSSPAPRVRYERTDTDDQMRRGRQYAATDRVCRTMVQPGSRLGGRRVCRTRAEWDAIATDSREATDLIVRQTRVPGG